MTARVSLALSGSAGTGKTTLAEELARRLDLPYVPEGMRARLEGGLALHNLDPSGLSTLVTELWEEQQAREREATDRAGGFVADRSPMDFFAFWLLYRCGSERETTRFYEQTRARLVELTRVVVLPWGVLPLVEDGIRSVDPWRQRHFQGLVEGLLTRYGRPGSLVWLEGAAPPADRADEALAGLVAEPRRQA